MQDGVAVATAGASGAAAVAGTSVVEVATAVPVVLAVKQVGPKGAEEATTAPVAVGVAVAEVVLIRPPATVGVAGGGATGREVCTTKESDFVPRCARFLSFTRGEYLPTRRDDKMELPDDDSEAEKVFAASATGKCSLTIGEEVGDVELDKQVAQYIAYSVATCHLTPDADGLTNYRECGRRLGLADRRKISIADYADLTVGFRCNNSWVHVKLHDVAHAPLLSYNLVSLTSLAQKGHPSAVEESGVTLKLKGGGTVQFLLIGKLCRQYGYRPEATGRMVDTACAVIAPGQAKAPTTPTDINFFHCTYGHNHEVLLKQTRIVALARGVALLGAKVPGLRTPRLTFIAAQINQLD